ncbi:helix-turn-helix domain-containing protein [Streptomyces celluloflavus]|uniref:helix-turn-helix domain-containing protein n=1 Tax=Streptomyces celluloflavus TaxID=58344 RepID=UPI0036DDB8E7
MSTQAQESREALGARLRGFRKDAGFISGRALARALNWQESKVSRIENGRQNASEDGIRVRCRATGHDADLADLIATVRHVDEMWTGWRRQIQDGIENRRFRAHPRRQPCRLPPCGSFTAITPKLRRAPPWEPGAGTAPGGGCVPIASGGCRWGSSW